MNPDQDQHRRNRLLAALRPRDYALLEPYLQIVPIGEGEFLHLPGDEIKQVYFLHRGIVSLMAISGDGGAIATASVGSEGAIGTIAGTGFVHAFTRAMVQAPGMASRIAVSHFRRAVSKSEAINDLLTRYHMALMCQVQQTSLCNSVHDATSRLSRLLLVLSEQGEDDTISFSQDRSPRANPAQDKTQELSDGFAGHTDWPRSFDSAHAIGRRYDAFWKTPRYDLAAPSIAPLQVLRFTTTYLQSVLAGQLGRFASSRFGRARSRLAFQNR